MSQDFQNDRPMVQGDWKCAECGTDITELPFKPSPDRPVHCKDCWRKKRDSFSGGGGGGGRRYDAPRPMVQGNWTCAGCGTEITQLPFRPAEGKPIYCRDCYRNQKGQR